MDCSLFSPILNLPWYLYPAWPLIFWRIQQLKAWFQRAGGPGSQMLWGVDRLGRVNILALSDDLSGRMLPRNPVAFTPSNAYRAALTGEGFYSRVLPDVRPVPRPVAAIGKRHRAALGCLGCSRALPLPDI
jgi:hypothetical protein